MPATSADPASMAAITQDAGESAAHWAAAGENGVRLWGVVGVWPRGVAGGDGFVGRVYRREHIAGVCGGDGAEPV